MIKSKLIFGDIENCKKPVLSIVIPTYRSTEYLYQAIDSALNQKQRIEYEIVVVSNDTDNTFEEIREKYKSATNLFIYQNEENIGLVGNANRCAELARGEFIAYLHDDDFLFDNYLDVVEKYVLNGGSVDCLITGRQMIFECKEKKSILIKNLFRKLYFLPDLYRKKIKRITLENCLKSGTNIYFSPSCGTVIRKSVFDSIGGFDQAIPYAHDFDFFLKLNASYDVWETTEICAAYRMGDNASLKGNVKFDFFDYFSNRFLSLMEENHVAQKYANKHRDELIFTVYKQLEEGLDKELENRNIKVKEINAVRLWLYRFRTTMYYYNHNLDIQRLK